MRVARFERGRGGVYTCRHCGKRTRDTGSGEQPGYSCRACFDAAGVENDHLDGRHEPGDMGPQANCPECQS